MLDFTLPTTEYVEVVHQQDIERAEAHRQIQLCRKTSHTSIIQRMMKLIRPDRDESDSSQSHSRGHDLHPISQNN